MWVMDVSPQWVYSVQRGVENLILPISLVLYSISCENPTGTLVLVLEAAKKSGAETRGSRTDKDQNTNQRPSAENLTRSASHLCLLVIALLDGTLMKLSTPTRYMFFWFVWLSLFLLNTWKCCSNNVRDFDSSPKQIFAKAVKQSVTFWCCLLDISTLKKEKITRPKTEMNVI